MARILLVEDDDFTAELLRMRLVEAGHEVTIAGDGLSAVTLADNTKPALVVLDWGLPAADGTHVLKLLRQHAATAKSPVIMISGMDRERVMDGETEGPLLRFLAKPVDFQELADLAAALLAGAAKG
ncbi:MAG: response regulator [Elusimicrobia bacterium]|nr:response regulator [Elusimicrobiota bacterium]